MLGLAGSACFCRPVSGKTAVQGKNWEHNAGTTVKIHTPCCTNRGVAATASPVLLWRSLLSLCRSVALRRLQTTQPFHPGRTYIIGSHKLSTQSPFWGIRLAAQSLLRRAASTKSEASPSFLSNQAHCTRPSTAACAPPAGGWSRQSIPVQPLASVKTSFAPKSFLITAWLPG